MTEWLVLICHLLSLARSSEISRVSCRLTSSHWATVLSRPLFCSLSLWWAFFSSATAPDSSLPSLLQQNKRFAVRSDHTVVTGGKHMLGLKEWNNQPGTLVVLRRGCFALRTWEIQSCKKIRFSDLQKQMGFRCFWEVWTKQWHPTVYRSFRGVWSRYMTAIDLGAERQEKSAS